jgi:hypothetical protein
LAQNLKPTLPPYSTWLTARLEEDDSVIKVRTSQIDAPQKPLDPIALIAEAQTEGGPEHAGGAASSSAATAGGVAPEASGESAAAAATSGDPATDSLVIHLPPAPSGRAARASKRKAATADAGPASLGAAADLADVSRGVPLPPVTEELAGKTYMSINPAPAQDADALD